MKGRILIFLLFAGAAAYFMLPRDTSLFTSTASVQTLPTTTNIPVPTPTNTQTPTSTPVPTATNTPVPTSTPQPTPTPTPVNLIGAWGRDRPLDQWFGVWFGRIMAILTLGAVTFISKLVYDMKALDKEMAHELRILALEVQKPPARPIMVNTRVDSGEEEVIVSPDGKQIPVRLVKDFIANYRLPYLGLQVSKWKEREGWSQSKIEAILDWLTGVGYITPRTRGMAAEWKTSYNSIQLARLFGLPTHSDTE